MSYTLTDYQQEAKTGIYQAYRDGARVVGIELPTGAGKTVVMGEVNQYILDSLEAMHIPKAALAKIDFNLDVLDEVKTIMHTTGLDAETARARAEDSFRWVGVKLETSKNWRPPN